MEYSIINYVPYSASCDIFTKINDDQRPLMNTLKPISRQNK